MYLVIPGYRREPWMVVLSDGEGNWEVVGKFYGLEAEGNAKAFQEAKGTIFS